MTSVCTGALTVATAPIATDRGAAPAPVLSKEERKQAKKKQPVTSFRFQTGDVAAICDLMYAMRDLTKTVRFHVTHEGVRIAEEACQENLFLFANFWAERFTSFEAVGESTISFYPEHLHKFLNSHQQRDIMICEFSSKNETKMFIKKYPDGSHCMEESYEIPLLLAEPLQYEAPTREVDYLLAFNSAMLATIIAGLNSIEKDFDDNWMNINCTPNMVQFRMEGGCMVKHAIFTLYTCSPEGREAQPSKRARRNKTCEGEEIEEVERVVHQQQVSQHYRLQYLHQMLKCFSITKGGIFMYVTRDYPIVFEIKVGSLGELKATLMFK